MNKIWKIEYSELPSNDKSSWLENSGELKVAAPTAERAIEKAKKHALRKANWWPDTDNDGNEIKPVKKVQVIGFRLEGVSCISTIDI